MASSLFDEPSTGISWDSMCREIHCEGAGEADFCSSVGQAQSINQSASLDPSVTHLSALLEEEDNPADIEANLTLSSLLAYNNKVCELACILKEDSPNLNFDLQPQLCRPSSHQLVPLNRPVSDFQIHQLRVASPQNWPIDEMVHPKPAGFQQRMLQPSPISLSIKLFDEGLFKRISAATTPHFASKITINRGDRKENTLKPHKEAHKLIGKPKVNDVYVDLNHLLLRCANAIGSNDTKAAMDALLKVKQHACRHGDGPQRMAYYFADALQTRLQGTGWQVYWGQMRQHERASPKEIFKARWMYMLGSPFAKAFRYLVNHTILDVAKKASVLHIMEYQFTGFQYPSLFKALAERTGGPPKVRLIAGNSPHYTMTLNQMELLRSRLEHTGSQLKACAACFGVPFHFMPWVGKTGTFNMSDYVDPNRGSEEVLVILSIYPLRYINDDLLSPAQKRQETLQAVRSMNPEAFIRGFVTAAYSTPFFARRFREALYHFECQYDILDTFIERDDPDRLVFESEILGRAILNLVACEEVQVVEKIEKYNQCYASMKRLGFEQVPLNDDLKCKIQNILTSSHKHYIAGEDLNYLLMGWKGRMLHAMAVWKGAKLLDEQQ